MLFESYDIFDIVAQHVLLCHNILGKGHRGDVSKVWAIAMCQNYLYLRRDEKEGKEAVTTAVSTVRATTMCGLRGTAR